MARDIRLLRWLLQRAAARGCRSQNAPGERKPDWFCYRFLVFAVIVLIQLSAPCKVDADRRGKWVRREHEPPDLLKHAFRVPPEFQEDSGQYQSPLVVDDGQRVETARQWQRRRAEILSTWHEILGPWPDLIEKPRVESVNMTRRGEITQRRVRIEVGLGGEMVEGFLLIPDGDGPFPAVLVVYYDAQTGVGHGTKRRDFAWQLARRGFVTLSIGKPNAGINLDDPDRIEGKHAPYFGPEGKPVRVQPLSALAYAAANAHTVLAQRPDVFSDRIGIVGHSFGGKWAMFASCLHEKFDCAVWSDPGIVFDERDRRKENPGGSVNYWDIWYLGFPLGKKPESMESYRFRKLPSEGEPRTGSYKQLIEARHDLHELHALMAPRPFLVSGGTADRPERWQALKHSVKVNELLGYRNRVAMTNRETHGPTEESNEQIYRFFQWWLTEQSDL
ncbi:MAG: sialidase [Planctomycetota bacterium]